MKRFGVQLAASGIVILLGALGVAQAQRESRTEEVAQWEQQALPTMTPPPAPIAAMDDEPAAEAPPSFGFGGFRTTSAVDPNIATVAHEEEVAAAPPTAFNFPGAAANDNPPSPPAANPAAGPSAFAMPSSLTPAPSDTVAAGAAPPAMSAFTLGTLPYVIHSLPKFLKPPRQRWTKPRANPNPVLTMPICRRCSSTRAPANGLRGDAPESFEQQADAPENEATAPIPAMGSFSALPANASQTNCQSVAHCLGAT